MRFFYKYIDIVKYLSVICRMYVQMKQTVFKEITNEYSFNMYSFSYHSKSVRLSSGGKTFGRAMVTKKHFPFDFH